MEPVDLRPTSRFPSFVEIAGLVFGLVPFAVSTASMSSHTVNGEVTSFEYRDWTAVGGGAAAGVCGVAALALLVRTDPAKRLLRVAAGCALLALAALQILRGFGVIGVSQPATSTFTSERTELVQKQQETPPPMPAVDVDKPTIAVFEAWRGGRTKEIHAAAHPTLREAATPARLEDLRAQLEYGYGAFEKVGPLKTSFEKDTFVLTGTAVYAKATLPVKLEYQLVDGKPLLSYLNFDIPEEVRIKPTPEDADATGRKLLDSLLAGKLDRTLLSPGLLEKVPEDVDAQLAALAKKIGKVKTIGKPKVTECSEHCLEITVTGAKAKAVFTTELAFQHVRWRATSFNLDLAK